MYYFKSVYAAILLFARFSVFQSLDRKCDDTHTVYDIKCHYNCIYWLAALLYFRYVIAYYDECVSLHIPTLGFAWCVANAIACCSIVHLVGREWTTLLACDQSIDCEHTHEVHFLNRWWLLFRMHTLWNNGWLLYFLYCTVFNQWNIIIIYETVSCLFVGLLS